MKRDVPKTISSFLALVLFSGLIVGREPVPAPISVTGVSLDNTFLSLVKGSSATLTATVSPDNADNKTVSWISFATDIATVDDNGKVTAVKVHTDDPNMKYFIGWATRKMQK